MKSSFLYAQKLCCVLFASALLPCHSATLFVEDFESLNVGNSISGGNSGNLPGSDANKSTVRDELLSTAFGSPNQFAEISDPSSGGSSGYRLMSSAYTETYNAVSTFQFDFHEPTVDGRTGPFNFGFGDDELTSDKLRARIAFEDGMLGDISYSTDTSYRVYMVMNDTLSPVAYSGGTLGAETADVWVEVLGSGTPIKAASIALGNSRDISGYSAGFRTFNGSLGNFYVDNVTLFEGAATVPEPSSAVMVGLAGCFLLFRRRR